MEPLSLTPEESAALAWRCASSECRTLASALAALATADPQRREAADLASGLESLERAAARAAARSPAICGRVARQLRSIVDECRTLVLVAGWHSAKMGARQLPGEAAR